MATSTEKLAALRPQVTAELEAALVGNTQVGLLLRPVLASIRPLLDAKVDAWLREPPERIDTLLGDLAATLLVLRSDDAPPVDLERALAKLRGDQLEGAGDQLEAELLEQLEREHQQQLQDVGEALEAEAHRELLEGAGDQLEGEGAARG